MKIALIIALVCLIVGALLVGLGWVLLQKYPVEKNIVKDSVYPYGMDKLPKQINISTLDSRVELRPIEGDEWRVECMDKEKLYHTVDLTEGVLTIKQIDTRQWYEYIGILNSLQSLSVIVYLPTQAYESLSIHSTSGSIKVQEGFAFSSATLKNTSGSITVNGSVGGDLTVKNTSGSIHVLGGVNGNLDVTGHSGSIEIKDATPMSVTVKNTSGGIDLINVICTGACNVENGSGSIELERCDATSFDVRTVSGGIRGSILSGKIFDCHSTSGGVHVPENGEGGIFKAKTTSGGIRITVVEQTQKRLCYAKTHSISVFLSGYGQTHLENFQSAICTSERLPCAEGQAQVPRNCKQLLSCRANARLRGWFPPTLLHRGGLNLVPFGYFHECFILRALCQQAVFYLLFFLFFLLGVCSRAPRNAPPIESPTIPT